MRRYTTRAQDIAFLRRLQADMHRDWKVGDACLSYRMDVPTTIAAIEGERVTLANGDQFHISHLRTANHLREVTRG